MGLDSTIKVQIGWLQGLSDSYNKIKDIEISEPLSPVEISNLASFIGYASSIKHILEFPNLNE